MLCPQCACEQGGPAQFCRQCGMHFAPAGGPYYANFGSPMRYTRVSQNLQPLAILWYVFGAMRILTGLAAMLALHTMSSMGWFMSADTPTFLPNLFHALAPIVFVSSAVMGALAILVGYGLRRRQSWARTLAIVVGILELLKFPFGTALGIYTLWVLAPSLSGEEWRRMEQVQAI